MTGKGLKRAADIAGRVGHILVATADAEGLPHVAAAGELVANGEEQVTVAAWFCPGTVANVHANARISLVAWDPGADEGCQLLGRVLRIEEVGILDGYAPEADGKRRVPQVERQLVVRVERVLDFTAAPHTDEEA